MDHLPLDLLKSFTAVARSGSFTEAGRDIGRTQAAVSLQIQRLEDVIGCPLFDRRARPLRLTQKGEILQSYAREILALNNRCLAELKGNTLVGQVKIGLPSDFAITFFPKILSRFVEANPDVTLDVTSDLSRKLWSSMEAEKYDLVLAIAPDEASPYFSKSWPDDICWVTAEASNAEKRSPLALVVHHEGCYYRARALERLKAQNIPHNIVYTGSSLSGIQSAVESGLGVTVLSKNSVPPNLKPIATDTMLPDLGKVNVGLFLPRSHRSKAARELSGFVEQAMDEGYG